MKSIYMWIILHEQPKVAWAWEKFGGSFTKGLSQALLHADPINAKKIHVDKILARRFRSV